MSKSQNCSSENTALCGMSASGPFLWPHGNQKKNKKAQKGLRSPYLDGSGLTEAGADPAETGRDSGASACASAEASRQPGGRASASRARGPRLAVSVSAGCGCEARLEGGGSGMRHPQTHRSEWVGCRRLFSRRSGGVLAVVSFLAAIPHMYFVHVCAKRQPAK